MPYLDYPQITELIPPREALRLIGYEGRLWKEPAGWRGPCPFHGSHAPTSRSLSIGKRGYHCHMCGAQGDSVQIVSDLLNVSRYEAAMTLCRLAGIDPPRRQ